MRGLTGICRDSWGYIGFKDSGHDFSTGGTGGAWALQGLYRDCFVNPSYDVTDEQHEKASF